MPEISVPTTTAAALTSSYQCHININESLIITLPVADQLYSILQYEFGNNVNCESVECQFDTSNEADGVVAVITRSKSKAKHVGPNK